MHQTIKIYLEREHSTLLSVTCTLYIYEVCHGVGHCVKDGSFSSSSLEWKLMDSINGISYYVKKCQTLSNTSQMTFFLSGRQRIGWLQALGSHTAVWLWVVSQEDWRNQGGTSWILTMHWYSIWMKKMRFSCFPVLPGSTEAQIIRGGTVKCLLVAYFIGNLSVKKYQNAFTYVKVIPNQRWYVFCDAVYIYCC